jgi:hypothetical protein
LYYSKKVCKKPSTGIGWPFANRAVEHLNSGTPAKSIPGQAGEIALLRSTALLFTLSKLLCGPNQFLPARFLLWLKVERPFVGIDYAAGVNVLGEEVEWEAVIPGGLQLFMGLERLAALLANRDVVIAIPVERGGRRRYAYLFVVEQHYRAGGVRVDSNPALNTSGQADQQNTKQQQGFASAHNQTGPIINQRRGSGKTNVPKVYGLIILKSCEAKRLLPKKIGAILYSGWLANLAITIRAQGQRSIRAKVLLPYALMTCAFMHWSDAK